MKKVYIIIGLFIAVLMFSNSVMAQTITDLQLKEYAEKLLAKEILTPEGALVMVEQVSKKQVEIDYPSTVKSVGYTSSAMSKETVLKFCEDAFASAQMLRFKNFNKIEGKIRPEEKIKENWTISITTFMGNRNLGKDYVAPGRSAMGLTPRRTLNDFLAIGLINEKIFKKCLDAIDNYEIQFEKDILHLMVAESAYQRFYDFHKQEQLEYIGTLAQIGLIDDQSRQQLIRFYEDSSLKSIPEILQYSNRYILVDLSKEDSSPATTYKIIFDSVRKLIPSFEYSDLSTTVTETKQSDLIRMDLTLGFTAKGIQYRHECFYNYYNPVKEKSGGNLPPLRIGENFQRIINQWLRDQESVFRLYTIDPDYYGRRQKRENDRVGLLLLKEGEAEKVSTDVSLISRENYDTRLSYRNINRFIDSFSVNGFFSHLRQDQIDDAKETLRRSSANSLGELLMSFPETVVAFDWETGNLNNPYEQLTHKLAKSTRGAVSVTSVADGYRSGWDKKAKKVKYGFVMNGRNYETMLPFNGDWLTEEFMEFFQKALDENKAGGRFHQCLFNGQEAGYIFLSDKQLDFITREFPELLLEEY